MVRLGTIKGAFVHSLLTILAVIMYFCFGWVLSNVGLLGTLTIILITFVVTATTAFSMSSIISDMKIGAGGDLSIISCSMGWRLSGAPDSFRISKRLLTRIPGYTVSPGRSISAAIFLTRTKSLFCRDSEKESVPV